MIARGAIGNPYLFRQIKDYLKKGKYEKSPNKKQLFLEYLKLAEKHKISFSQIKRQAVYFTKGMRNGAELRRKINTCKNAGELKNAFWR